jgi:hypothetical protein
MSKFASLRGEQKRLSLGDDQWNLVGGTEDSLPRTRGRVTTRPPDVVDVTLDIAEEVSDVGTDPATTSSESNGTITCSSEGSSLLTPTAGEVRMATSGLLAKNRFLEQFGDTVLVHLPDGF